MKRRTSKKNDQKETERAFQIIQKAIEEHPEIEPTLWAGALFSKIVQGCETSGLSYLEFCEMIDDAKNFYKRWFDK